MRNILNEIKERDLQSEKEQSIEEIARMLEGYYIDNNGRHSYAEVSTFIYSTSEGDFEYIINNLLIIKNYYNKQSGSKYADKVSKLIDHIQLELNREEHIQQVYIGEIGKRVTALTNKKVDEMNDSISGFNIKLGQKMDEITKGYETIENKYNNLLNKQKRQINGLHNNLISVLGIFSAVIVAFFGGLSILGSVLQNMHNVSKYRLCFIVLLIAFFMFNVIFMLLRVIAKITDKEISASCNKELCLECGKQPGWKCVKNKYPMCFWYNAICLGLMGVLFIMYIIDSYNVVSYIMSLFYKKVLRSTVPLIFLLGTLVIIILIILIEVISSIKCKNKNNFFGKDNGVGM